MKQAWLLIDDWLKLLVSLTLHAIEYLLVNELQGIFDPNYI